MSLAQLIGTVFVLAAWVVGLHLLPLGAAKLDRWLATPALTPNELRRAAGLGPDWHVIQVNADAGAEVPHHCRGLYWPRAAARPVAMCLPFAPASTSGVAAAKCPTCRTAWLRVAAP